MGGKGEMVWVCLSRRGRSAEKGEEWVALRVLTMRNISAMNALRMLMTDVCSSLPSSSNSKILLSVSSFLVSVFTCRRSSFSPQARPATQVERSRDCRVWRHVSPVSLIRIHT